MGKQNRITKDKYNKIKEAIHSLRKRGYSAGGIDDIIKSRFNIGATTARYIRNTANYDIYRLKTAKGRSQKRYEMDREAYKRLNIRRAAPKESYAQNVLLLGFFGLILLTVIVCLAILLIKFIGAAK